jgi:hypothetical protein
MSPHTRSHHAKRRLDDLIRKVAQTLDHHREFYWRLIHTLRASSQLLVPSHCQGPSRALAAERVVSACVYLAVHAKHWERQPEGWYSPDPSPFAQFRSLVEHLFVRYKIPNFMARVWLAPNSNAWERQLYLHLARGHSIRSFQTPFRWEMGKPAARFFMQAPDDLAPMAAFRWSRVRSLGGDERLARIVLKTVLASHQQDESFWDTVMRFLVKNQPLSAEEIAEMIDFIHGQKFRPAETVWGRGAGPTPLQPAFTLQGWSLSRLRRHMVHWRAERLAATPSLSPAKSDWNWQATLIKPFHFQTPDETWTIHELLTGKELRAEGAIMQHCVANYIPSCARRKTTIWSMQVHTDQTRKHVLTIEVRPDEKWICQAKGRKNAPPSEAARRMLDRWAIQEGLRIGAMATG